MARVCPVARYERHGNEAPEWAYNKLLYQLIAPRHLSYTEEEYPLPVEHISISFVV